MKNLKYILTKESIQFGGRTFYRIKALKDFGDVKAGDLGGYIEKELNLSQGGNCWVSDNAVVLGNARVRDNAIATKEVITFRNIYTLTMTDNHIRYGCIQKTIGEWKLFLDSDEVIETKRDTDKFKAIESTLREGISIWENNKDS